MNNEIRIEIRRTGVDGEQLVVARRISEYDLRGFRFPAKSQAILELEFKKCLRTLWPSLEGVWEQENE